MKLMVTKVCRGVLDTDAERQRIKKAFRDDPVTRDRLNQIMDAVEALDWDKAYKLLSDKWWRGRDKKQECSRLEFIGTLDMKNPESLESPASGFDYHASYIDFILSMEAEDKPGDVEYKVEKQI
jgi:hypothetical protein